MVVTLTGFKRADGRVPPLQPGWSPKMKAKGQAVQVANGINASVSITPYLCGSALFGGQARDQTILHLVEIAHGVQVQVEQLQPVGLCQ